MIIFRNKIKCKNQFEAIYKLIRNRVDNTSPDSSASPSTSQRSTRSSQSSVKKVSGTGKENSPTKKSNSKSKRSSKEALKDMSIDPKPSKEKRTKQTKLPFFTTSSAKKRHPQNLLDDEDEDMTYCEELERRLANSKDAANKPANDSPGIFNFGSLENFQSRKPKEKTSTNVEHPKELTPQKAFGITIKTEKTDDKSFRDITTPLSPDLFLSDLSNSNSVIFIEPPEKEVISISDRTYNPTHDLLREIQKEVKQSRKNILLEDSNPIETQPKVPLEEREAYEGECLDCQIVSISIN